MDWREGSRIDGLALTKKIGKSFPLRLAIFPVKFARKKGTAGTHFLSNHWSAVHASVVLYLISTVTEDPFERCLGRGTCSAHPITGCLGLSSYCHR